MTKPPESGKQRIMFDLSVTAAIARLVLDRPKALNAIPVAGWQDLASAAAEAVRADARILIVSGVQDGAFCAGADISAFDAFQADPEARTPIRKAIRPGLATTQAVHIPPLVLVASSRFAAGAAHAHARGW